MIVGVDPGLNGAISFYEPNKSLKIFDMPTHEVKRHGVMKRELSPQALAAIFTGDDFIEHAYVERVGATPQMGVTSAFSFGLSQGIVLGALAARGVPTTVITPQTWQRFVKKREGKDGSRQRACELFPSYADLFARVKDDGRSDSALIAYYGAKHALS